MFQLLKHFDNFTSHSMSMLTSTRKFSSHWDEYPAMQSNGPPPQVELGDTTWEPYNECKELVALDRYLELLGINDDDWKKLPRRSLTINHHSSNRSNINVTEVRNFRRRK